MKIYDKQTADHLFRTGKMPAWVYFQLYPDPLHSQQYHKQKIMKLLEQPTEQQQEEAIAIEAEKAIEKALNELFDNGKFFK